MAKKDAHHGGSWKVAYADFVTAMMALFLCLWLTSQDQKIKDAVERAFRNPFSSVTKESVGIIPNKEATSTFRQQGLNDCGLSYPAGKHQHSFAAGVAVIRIGPFIQQELHDIEAAPWKLFLSTYDRC